MSLMLGMRTEPLSVVTEQHRLADLPLFGPGSASVPHGTPIAALAGKMGYEQIVGKGHVGWWLRQARIARVVSALALSVGSAASLSGCLDTTNVTNDCRELQQRCTDRGREVCGGGLGFTGWKVDACPSETPFCVETEPDAAFDVECVSEPHCSATEACETKGLCADSEHGCVATEEGCANACPNGECVLDGARCAFTDLGCASRPDCKARGNCGAGPFGCQATVSGCAESDSCKGEGYCGVVDSTCEVTAEGCANSEACQRVGLCGLSPEGTCEPTAEGCANSTNCMETGFCRLQDGYCQK